MNKKRIIAVILIVVVCLSGCLPEDRWPHKVTFDGHEDLYEYDKDKTDYYQGEKVVVYFTAVGTDMDYSFFLNGERIEPEYEEEKGYKIVFEMPGYDVDISYNSGGSMEQDMSPASIVSLKIGDEFYAIEQASGVTAGEFFRRIEKEKLSLKMTDFGSIDKYADLPWELSTDDDKLITANPGDLVLYQGKTLALLYDDNTAEYTKLGSIGQGVDEKKEISEKLKKTGDIEVEFVVDYTE